jgi:nucleotide-binding universal stress UspA family protein
MVAAQVTPIAVGIHNLLIAIDFSRCSNLVLQHGLALAKEYNAQAQVVFVLPTNEFLVAGPDAFVAAREAACRDLNELKTELKLAYGYEEGKDYHLFLLEGDVAQCVLEFADKKQIDLIVLGTHGRGGLGKALMGSVAEKVFRRSPVPVLTIGPCHRGSSQRNEPKNILAATDFTPASERALRYAAALARRHKATLTVLHVLKRSAAEAAVAEVKTKLAAVLGSEAGEAKISFRVDVGPVVPTILHVATEIGADLLVVGVRPSLGVLDRLTWPHAYEIVRESACPVLTFRKTFDASN